MRLILMEWAVEEANLINFEIRAINRRFWILLVKGGKSRNSVIPSNQLILSPVSSLRFAWQHKNKQIKIFLHSNSTETAFCGQLLRMKQEWKADNVESMKIYFAVNSRAGNRAREEERRVSSINFQSSLKWAAVRWWVLLWLCVKWCRLNLNSYNHHEMCF